MKEVVYFQIFSSYFLEEGKEGKEGGRVCGGMNVLLRMVREQWIFGGYDSSKSDNSTVSWHLLAMLLEVYAPRSRGLQ